MPNSSVPTWARRAAWYAAAPLFGLLLYWRVPSLWFVNDDFAWLGLPLELRRGFSLLHVLFAPYAQGTVRVLSDRLFFLVFSELFGLHALPYRIWILGTWIAVLTLVSLIGAKLTGSRAAGLLAALLWAANTNAVPAVAWASAYNQVLCGLCLLAAFYSRLRGWRAAEWIAYLAGFGALEVIVVYPVLALLHARCVGPAHGRSPSGHGPAKDRPRAGPTMWLFLPACVFAAIHFLFIPKAADGVYALSLDGRLATTSATYLAWMFEPGSSALRTHAAAYGLIELAAGILIGAALALFAARELAHGKWIALFFCGWFAILLAPVLPLANHLTSYYLTLPSIGLAWLGGWAIAEAWHSPRIWRATAAALAAVYLLGSAAGINAQTRWYKLRGERMHMLVEAVAATAAAHPGDAIAVVGVDDELYDSGFEDHPFRLVGAAQVQRLDHAPEETATRVLQVTAEGVRDVTGRTTR